MTKKATPASVDRVLRETIERMRGWLGREPPALACSREQWRVVTDQLELPRWARTLRVYHASDRRVYYGETLLHPAGAPPEAERPTDRSWDWSGQY